MNRYPLWKYILIAVVLIVGLVYTLPNFYGESPAVQVSSAKSTVKLDERVLTRVEKALDEAKLKPNGIMAVITSASTMDKRSQAMRKYVADRAELIGAIRLPNTAFKQIAGTEVVADILFFQKREEKIYADGENTKWLASKALQDGYFVNEYFLYYTIG